MLDIYFRDPVIDPLLDNRAIAAAMVRVEIALAHATAEAGLTDPAHARDIETGLEGFVTDTDGLMQCVFDTGTPVSNLVKQSAPRSPKRVLPKPPPRCIGAALRRISSIPP